MQYLDMQEALKDVTMFDKKDKIFVELLNLRAMVNRLLARNAELEKDDMESNFFMF